MDPRGLRVTQTTYFLLLTHANQLSSVTFCEMTVEIGKNESVTERQTDGRMEGQTDVKYEIVIQMRSSRQKNGKYP